VRGRRAPGTARPGIRQPRRAHRGGGICGRPRAQPGVVVAAQACHIVRARLVPAWASVRRADATSFASARAWYDAAAAARADPPAGPRRRSPVSGGELPPNGHFDARNIQICHQNDGSDHKNAVWPVYTASRSGTSAIPSWALIRSHIAATTSTAMLRSVSSSAVVAYRPCLNGRGSVLQLRSSSAISRDPATDVWCRVRVTGAVSRLGAGTSLGRSRSSRP
jgi:hypothetical protein